MPKRRKIDKTRCRKPYFFGMSILKRFYSDFSEFGSILGGSGLPKNWQKSKKFVFGPRLEGLWAFRMTLGSILERFYEIGDGFSNDFEEILNFFDGLPRTV